LTDRWKLPKERLYATVYRPGPGEPADFDQEAYDFWKAIFEKEGLDPKLHIIDGNKKDNFWMMGDTGPCGPCSEIHMDLTPKGDTGGKLVNADDARCIEIWNLVFIQFNANPDGSYSDLPAKHVDTGMGFERVCSILQGTKGFTDFSKQVSNYDTDIFSPIFKELEKLSGRKYQATLPLNPALVAPKGTEGGTRNSHSSGEALAKTEPATLSSDTAMRVIADHIRTLSLSIADGIIPGNEGRNYVLRRILRRAIRYGRELGLQDLFFYKLVAVIVREMGPVFPELKENQAVIERIIRAEEERFTKTLDRGIELFEKVAGNLGHGESFPGDKAFELYDTYGFPIDLTILMAKEKGIEVDRDGFEECMEEQRRRSQDAQKKSIISVQEQEEDLIPTTFVGFDQRESTVELLNYRIDMPEEEGGTVRARLYLSPTPFYAEMGGQVGDSGHLLYEGEEIEIIDTLRSSPESFAHITEQVGLLEDISFPLTARVDGPRRSLIEGHHSATHILHWALREVLGPTVSQKGSYVGPDRLRFDFSHMEAMKAEEIAKVEELANERIAEASKVAWNERPYAEVKNDPSILQFFGDKYGEVVRVVDIGGFSIELCGGTHVRNTAEIGPFRIISEGAIAAGIRRLEAVSGLAINHYLQPVFERQESESGEFLRRAPDLKAPALLGLEHEPADSWNNFLQNQSALEQLKEQVREWDKQQAKARQAELLSQAATLAPEWAKEADHTGTFPLLIKHIEGADGKFLQVALGELKKHFQGVAVLAGNADDKVALAASVSPDCLSKIKAGDIIKTIAPHVGGKGGGRPKMAQGGGTNVDGIPEALNTARHWIRSQPS
jgi:alanyl-tRNA synthetase